MVAAAVASAIAAQIIHERVALARERAHVGLDFGGEAIDGDEQGELTVGEGVEDLTVVTAGPHTIPVGHETQLGELLAVTHELADGAADPRERQPGIEQLLDHSQRDEIAEGVRAFVVGVR